MYIAYALLSLALSILVAINHFFWHSTTIGAILGSCYIIGGGWYLGQRISLKLTAIATMAGILLWVAFLAGVSGLAYRFLNLAPSTVILIIALTPLVLIFLSSQRFIPKANTFLSNNNSITQEASASENTSYAAPALWHGRISAWTNHLLIITIAVILTIAAILLFTSRTGEALRSPWTVVPPVFFSLIFLANLLALAFGFRSANKRSLSNQWLVLVLLTTISLVVAVIIYGIGYGFDPFVHQATELLIQKNGIVLPKQWYYSGQYGLVVALAALFHADVILIDKLLLPIIASLAIPTVLLLSLNKLFDDHQSIFLSTLALLAIPLGGFINTTPQGLGNLILLSIIFLSFTWHGETNAEIKWLLWGLSIVAAIIHPLAGLPAIIFLSIKSIRQKRFTYYVITALIVIFGAIIPLLFWIQEKMRGSSLPTIISVIDQSAVPVFYGWLYFEQRYNLILDAVYHFAFNLPLIILVLATLGIILSCHSKQLKMNWPHLLTAAVLAIDGFILNNFLPFRYLIDYERAWYGNRLWEMAVFFLLPYVVITLLTFFKKLLSAQPMVIMFWVLVLATLRTTSVYLTYPRFDTYAYDRGYSPSVYDVEAVRAIESEARGPYIVLANQATSAAALRELGFKQYFSRRDATTGEQIFFYPIPTGGSLYQYYLKLVYEKPSRRTMEEAMNMVGVNEAYFVLNDYWANSKKIAEAAKSEADGWEVIDGGKIYIFKYRQLNSAANQ